MSSEIYCIVIILPYFGLTIGQSFELTEKKGLSAYLEIKDRFEI